MPVSDLIGSGVYTSRGARLCCRLIDSHFQVFYFKRFRVLPSRHASTLRNRSGVDAVDPIGLLLSGTNNGFHDSMHR